MSSTTQAPAPVDKTAPNVALVGGPTDGGSYYLGAVPVAPTCSASDALSGLAAVCTVSGYSTEVGPHTVLATATDNAGNVKTVSATYTVLQWTVSGFHQPVDMSGVWNTVKGGATVPLKFEIFAGSTEVTDLSVIVQRPNERDRDPGHRWHGLAVRIRAVHLQLADTEETRVLLRRDDHPDRRQFTEREDPTPVRRTEQEGLDPPALCAQRCLDRACMRYTPVPAWMLATPPCGAQPVDSSALTSVASSCAALSTSRHTTLVTSLTITL